MVMLDGYGLNKGFCKDQCSAGSAYSSDIADPEPYLSDPNADFRPVAEPLKPPYNLLLPSPPKKNFKSVI